MLLLPARLTIPRATTVSTLAVVAATLTVAALAIASFGAWSAKSTTWSWTSTATTSSEATRSATTIVEVELDVQNALLPAHALRIQGGIVFELLFAVVLLLFVASQDDHFLPLCGVLTWG